MPLLPRPVASFDGPRFLGKWFILATNYGFWRRRIHPTVTYGAMPGPSFAMTDRLCFEVRPPLGRGFTPKALDGIDREVEPGRFVWRGKGILGLIRSPWCVAAVGPDYDWAVTYFARSNIGTGAGVDIYARTPTLPPERVNEILRQVRADPFMARASEGLFEIRQKGVEPGRYRL